MSRSMKSSRLDPEGAVPVQVWSQIQKQPSRALPQEQEVAVEEMDAATPWRVFLFNDEIHTFDEVISQLIKATGCSQGRAEDLAWTVHNEGKAMVFEGEFEECLRVQGVLREIGLITEIRG